MEDHLIVIDIEKKMQTAEGVMNLAVQASIKTGELTALFGKSGSGKTTLLRILSGLTKPDRGFIKAGRDIWFDSSKGICLTPQKRNISLMFQDYALFPTMTVEQNLLYAQPQKNVKAINKLLKTFGLEEFRNTKPVHLSGGQKQRVALARSIARKPGLLMLDEPLSALDNAMRAALQDEILKTHQEYGITTIMVSHDLHEVFRLASRVMKIEQGTVSAFGTPDEVFINQQVSGKVQIAGQLARIEKQGPLFLLTVIIGHSQIIKVVAFEDDIMDLNPGDKVLVLSKAFNPMVIKLME